MYWVGQKFGFFHNTLWNFLANPMFSVTAIQGRSVEGRMKNVPVKEGDRSTLILSSHKNFLESHPVFEKSTCSQKTSFRK